MQAKQLEPAASPTARTLRSNASPWSEYIVAVMFESSLVHNNGSRRGEGGRRRQRQRNTDTQQDGKHRPRIRVSAKARSAP